jgi:predicted RecB family nuclease
MRMSGSAIELSASDLSGFLSCVHLTALGLAVARGEREAPTWVDPVVRVLRERGLEHEHSYVEELRAQGLTITDLSGAITAEHAVTRSMEEIRAGVDVILQPALRNSRWFGRPDVLRRNGTPSALGAWSYEVFDTKLAKETRGGTILQLGLYSELLSETQGMTPEHFHVVTPDSTVPVRTYRVDDLRSILPANPSSFGGNLTSGSNAPCRRKLSRAGRILRNLPLAMDLRQEETR